MTEMTGIIFLRDPDLPFLEIKRCDTVDNLSYKRHFHEEISIGLIKREPPAYGRLGNGSRLHRGKWFIFRRCSLTLAIPRIPPTGSIR